jgi:hypothetical protein
MNLKITPDKHFRNTYLLEDGKAFIGIVHEDYSDLTKRELSLTRNRMAVEDIQEILDFIKSYDKWLTDDQW